MSATAGGNSFRTPLDFSLAGTFPSNCTQLAIMRTTMSRENAAALQQQQMKELHDKTEQQRYWSAIQAVRDRDQAQQAKTLKLQQAKANAEARAEIRKAKVAAFSYSPQIFPFSSHRQRIPPPTLQQQRRGAATSRTARTQQQQQRGLTHRAPPPMTQHEARLFQQQQQQQSSYHPYPPQQHQQFSSTYNPSYSSQDEYVEQSQYPESARASNSFSSTAAYPATGASSRPPLLSDGFESGKPRFDSSTVFGRPTFKEPLPFNARPKVEITPLPYSSEQLRQMGQRPVQHPFYEYGTRLSNPDDEEYSRMVNERYRGDIKEVMPHDRVPTPTKLPPNFDINGWSVEHGAHRKRCRETAIEEFLISKGYL